MTRLHYALALAGTPKTVAQVARLLCISEDAAEKAVRKLVAARGAFIAGTGARRGKAGKQPFLYVLRAD